MAVGSHPSYLRRDPAVMGGQLTLAGRRYPVAQLLAELADGRTIQEVARESALDVELLRGCLKEIADRLAANRGQRIEL